MSAKSRHVGFVTKSGAFVAEDILARHAIKSNSEQIDNETFKSIHGLVEPLYDPNSLARHMEANTYHARAVRTKAQDSAGLGWELNPTTDNPNDEQKALVEKWFDELDEEIDEVLLQAMTDRESVGWFSIELVRENKEPEGVAVLLKNIPAHTMRAHQDRKRFIQQRGSKRVWFKLAGLTDIDVHKTDGSIHEAGSLEQDDRANEVIWNNIYTSRSDVYGVPDHIPAMGAILGDVARRDYNIAFFENYGVPAYAVHITGDFDPGDEVDDNGNTEEEIDADPNLTQSGDFQTPLHRDIEAHVKDLAKNPHSVLVLGIPSVSGEKVEVKFEPLAVEVKEASFRLYRQDNLKEVLSAHAVPPYRAGIAEQGSLGGNVAENMDEIYRDSVLAPRQRILNRLINRFVLQPMEITDWEFALATIDLTDLGKELDIALKLFENGAMSPNDLIRNFGDRFGVQPINEPSMDAHYIDGSPVTEIEAATDVEAVMLSVRDTLLDVATKHVGESGNADALIEAIAAIKRGSS